MHCTGEASHVLSIVRETFGQSWSLGRRQNFQRGARCPLFIPGRGGARESNGKEREDGAPGRVSVRCFVRAREWSRGVHSGECNSRAPMHRDMI